MPIATVNPATSETVKTFPPHDDTEIERRIAQAAAAAAVQRDSGFARRAEWMSSAADIIEADADPLARLLTLEMGKTLAQSVAEVTKCARAMRYFAQNAEAFLADEPLADPASVSASKAWTVWQPLGVVLAVMPWNLALWQVIRFAAPALMAGNAGLLKHASNVPQTALYLDTLFERGGFPVGSFRTLLISSHQVPAVLADERVKAVTLTGSEPAGRSVAGNAGQHIKKSVMELGGSDPFIVMPSADLDAASTTAVHARVQNNGQSCIAAKRFIVHADVYDEFTRLFTGKMAKLVVGDPMDQATDVGPLATESGRSDLAELYRAANRQEAAQIANQTSFGLGSAVWTTDPDEQDWFIRNIDAGAVFVNGMTESHAELPFGGIKNSGYGRELTKAGIREFCNLKTVWQA